MIIMEEVFGLILDKPDGAVSLRRKDLREREREIEEEMGETLIWEEIEHSESYLVCSLYDEAASLASSVLKRLRDDKNVISKKAVDDIQLHDILESTGMVLVQSLKGLGRTSEILKELRILFAPLATIPVKVLLTGVCFQLSEGSSFGVREILEEFLSKWIYVDEGYYVLVGAEANVSFMEGCDGNFCLGIDVYMEIVEVYAVTFIGKILKDVDLAISWVEKAALVEEKRQGLLRKLHSLYVLNATNVLQCSSSLLPEDNHEACSSLKDPIASEGSKTNYLLNGGNDTKQTVLKLSGQESPSFWWLNTIILKFGKVWLVVSNGKIVLSFCVFLLYYVLRRKRATLKRTFRRQVLSIKKALVDLWQLAFSYQVNPLAAVQPLPAAARGGQ